MPTGCGFIMNFKTFPTYFYTKDDSSWIIKFQNLFFLLVSEIKMFEKFSFNLPFAMCSMSDSQINKMPENPK